LEGGKEEWPKDWPSQVAESNRRGNKGLILGKIDEKGWSQGKCFDKPIDGAGVQYSFWVALAKDRK
jgi:hypothetical protein